jgi:hypothetical protein
VGGSGEEVVPTNVLTAGFGDSNVNEVSGPSQRANTEQSGEVVVQARFSVFEPSEARTELRL